MKRTNWGYSADRSHPNWTGRVPRQSRITGVWSSHIQVSRHIPLRAYAGGILVAVVLLFVLPFVGTAAGY